MSGPLGDVPADGDDTTAAEARPPAGMVTDEEEDRTVQSISLDSVKPRPAAGAPPRPSAPRAITALSRGVEPPPPPSTIADVPRTVASKTHDEEDPITATAPRVTAANLGLSVSAGVQIKTNDDLLDDTEARTMPGARPGRAPDPPRKPAASDTDDDGPTTQAAAPRMGSKPD